MSTTGHCLCGATVFTYEGDEIWCTHCHCESCRRQTSSPFTTFVAVPRHVAYRDARDVCFEPGSYPFVLRHLRYADGVRER